MLDDDIFYECVPMTSHFDISDPEPLRALEAAEDADDGQAFTFGEHLPRPPKGPRISGCSAHQSTAKDETRSPMDSDDIEADAAQCLQLPAELCPRPPELCPEPSGDEDGLATYSSQLSGVTPEVAHRPMKPGKGRAKVDEFAGRTVRLALSAENSRRDAENSRRESVNSLSAVLLLDTTATIPETRLLEQCEPIELTQGSLSAPDGVVRSAAGEIMLGCLQGLQDLCPDAASPLQIELALGLLSDEDGNARCEPVLFLPLFLTAAKEEPTPLMIELVHGLLQDPGSQPGCGHSTAD